MQFVERRGERQSLAQIANHRLQDVTIGAVFTTLSRGLKLSIEFQKLYVRNGFPMTRENRLQHREDARFPIDKRAIAIESEDFEVPKLQHNSSRVLART